MSNEAKSLYSSPKIRAAALNKVGQHDGSGPTDSSGAVHKARLSCRYRCLDKCPTPLKVGTDILRGAVTHRDSQHAWKAHVAVNAANLDGAVDNMAYAHSRYQQITLLR